MFLKHRRLKLLWVVTFHFTEVISNKHLKVATCKRLLNIFHVYYVY